MGFLHQKDLEGLNKQSDLRAIRKIDN